VPALTGVTTLPYFSLYCLFLFFQVCATPVEQVYLLRQQPQRLLWWGIASFVVPPVALLIPLWAGWGFGAALVGLTGSAAARFGWTWVVAWPCWRAPVPPGLWASYRRLAMPLVAGSLVGNLIVLFDPWLVGRYFADAGTFALYRYGTRELPLALALATALSTALTPRLSADLPAGLAELKRSTRRLFHWVFPPAIVLLFLTKPLFPVVFNLDFADSAPLFNIYLLLTVSRVLLPNAVVLAKQKAHILLIVSIAELVLKIVLGYWFIQWWGLSGLAWSAVLAFWFEKIALIVYLECKTDLRTRDWLDLRWYISYVLVLLAAYVWVCWRG
jgi:O-antigen/teichoic acid export membrane protein